MPEIMSRISGFLVSNEYNRRDKTENWVWEYKHDYKEWQVAFPFLNKNL